MILVTVGADEPFDRLIEAVDAWAGERGRSDVFAQVGESSYRPRHIESVPFLTPSEFQSRVSAAEAIVAHAGMGTIIAALQLGKPLVVMPRRGHLRETRNDHQLATARRFEEKGTLAVALDESELVALLDDLGRLRGSERIPPYASPELLGAIRTFIDGN